MGTTNVSLDTIWKTKQYPRGLGTSNFGSFQSSKFRVIRLSSNDYTKGNVSFTYPITLSNSGASVGDNYAWSYLSYTYVIVTATATYPYTFQRWETVLPTAGTLLSTNSNISLYNTDWSGYYSVRAVFA
jgi:hypothetical protein